MALEIERKFLVTGQEYKSLSYRHEEIAQGYLCRDIDATVRVRLRGENGFITVKSRNEGCVRHEWEYAIPAADAEEMLETCPGKIIRKTRWLVAGSDSLVWEVDEFHGSLQGLVVAEVELPSVGFEPVLPPFIGEEVTGDPRYYNSALSAG